MSVIPQSTQGPRGSQWTQGPPGVADSDLDTVITSLNKIITYVQCLDEAIVLEGAPNVPITLIDISK